MAKKNLLANAKVIWERDYRSILQGLRSALAVLVVIIIYAYHKDHSLFFMGLCALGLSQACARTMYWRYEINMLISYFISIMLIFISYPYSQYILTTYLYLFLITFLLYIFSYYQISSTFSIWAYFIPLNSIMSIKSYDDFIKFLLMDTVAFSICYFISVVIIPPKIKKECYYELKSVLHEVNSYLKTLEAYTKDKNDKNALILTKKRDKIFLRLKNLRLLMSEISSYIKKGKIKVKEDLLPFFVTVKLIEKYVENILGISLKIRNINITLNFEDLFNKLDRLINKTNNDFLKFLSDIKLLNLRDLGVIFEKIYINTLVEFKLFEKMSIKYQDNEIYDEILALVLQLKDNISLINKEFKILSKEDQYVFN